MYSPVCVSDNPAVHLLLACTSVLVNALSDKDFPDFVEEKQTRCEAHSGDKHMWAGEGTSLEDNVK